MQLLPASPERGLPTRRAGALAMSATLHGAAVLLLALLPAGQRATGQPASTSPVVAFVQAPPSRDEFRDRVLAEDRAAADAPAQHLRVAGFDFDVTRIRARRNMLFPFLTLDLLFLQGLDDQVRSANRRLPNPFPARERPTARPPLLLTDEIIQDVVDRTWSRRGRWDSFAEIATLIDAHDPDQGRLADLLHDYLDQNILQPYFASTVSDPRFWTMLGLAADHADFIDLVRAFARRHSSSRTTTELLFLLDELAQGSRDALLILLETEPAADLEQTRLADRDAYELAMAIRSHYRAWLTQRGLDTSAAITARYDELRLRILATIIESTPGGYRAADARYLAGEIFFNQNNTAEALEWWRDIVPGEGDSYAAAYLELLAELQSPSGLSAADASAIVGAERRRWLEFSRQRLRRFGYSFTTF